MTTRTEEERTRTLQSCKITIDANTLVNMTKEQQDAIKYLLEDSRWTSADIHHDFSVGKNWLYCVMNDGYVIGISPEGSTHS